MQFPLQIAFRNIEPCADLEDEVRERVERLEDHHRDILGCRVVIDVPHRHHRHGNLYLVRIDLTVPGGELVVNRTPPERTACRDFAVALRDAFDAARRLLEDHARRRRSVKVEEPT